MSLDDYVKEKGIDRMTRSDAFGITEDGQPVRRYILKNGNGMEVKTLNYGCTIQSILIPTGNGEKTDVVLGYDDINGYENGNCYFGAFVGRYANRIKGAQFSLNGKTYHLEKNDGNNHLHGVYSRQLFESRIEGESLVFSRVSPAGEEGYPGTLMMEIRYSLREDNALEIEYTATSDEDTVVNFTNHSYFNLNGKGDILKHRLFLDADRFTEGDEETIPTGEVLSVENTPMDFREGKCIGDNMDFSYGQIALCKGYDHNYIINRNDTGLVLFARAEGEGTGISMEAYTTEPAVQLYTGSFVDTDPVPCGKGGMRYPRYGGFCLETQHYPCSPNYPEFPSTVLHAGKTYRHKTVYCFHW